MQVISRLFALFTLAFALLASQGCATLEGRDSIIVTVAGIEPLESQGLELRVLVKLRVQNPNDVPANYSGVAVEIKVRGKTFATGVSDAVGSVPRFGEAVISVPVTVSTFSVLGQALDMIRNDGSGPITYEMKGKLKGSGSNSTHFRSRGELELPATATLYNAT